MKENREGLKPSEIDRLLAKIKPRPVVALVDDDLATLDLLERTLGDEGYEIYRFERGEDLLAKFSEIRPDVLVIEAVLPGISGLTVLDEVRPKHFSERVPILILSQKTDIHAKLLAFRRGASDYVTKPFEAEEVACRVRALVRSKVLQETLEKSAVSDPLTRLYNRRFLTAWLEQEMERVKRYGLELSCILFDFDHFHKLNQEGGEPFGDFLLREFAQIMLKNSRRSDIAGRIENDEFSLFLPGTTKEQAMILARRLKRLIGEHPFEWKEKKAHPSFCIGITGCHPKDEMNADLFLERVKEALAKAKSVGSGQTAVLEIPLPH